MNLYLTLISDATFGRGDGVAGLVNEEVEHDAATGLPYLRGRALKGLLVEECANLLFALGTQAAVFTDTAKELFGEAGSALEDDGLLHVGTAQAACQSACSGGGRCGRPALNADRCVGVTDRHPATNFGG